MTAVIQGSVEPGFEDVADVFARTARPVGGSALSIRVGGRAVVDLWQGTAGEGREWMRDTPTVVFSCTKGLLALIVARLVERGLLVLDTPVADIWPEFAAAGKEGVTVRQLLSHRAGLAAPRVDVDLDTALDWRAITAVLAAQEPLWAPGSAYGYHALTYGWLVGEVIHRVTGMSIGEAFRVYLAAPIDADAWVGMPAAEEHRVARLIAGESLSGSSALPGELDDDARWAQRSMTLGAAFPVALVVPGAGFDDPRVHAAEVPGAGGIATAAALADIWSSAVVPTGHTSPLTSRVVDDMTAVQSEGEPVWWIPGPYPRWGSGFMLTSQRREFLSPSSFGHDGAGGQVAFADAEAAVGFGYVTNAIEVADDERGTELVRSLRRALGG